jgi:AraC-like DNA-binding protein
MLIASGHATHSHGHSFTTAGWGRWVLGVVWEGNPILTIGNHALTCDPGTSLLVRAGTAYRIEFNGRGQETWVFFDPPAAWRELLLWTESLPGIAQLAPAAPHATAVREAVREAHHWWSSAERQRLWLATNALERALLQAALDVPGASLSNMEPNLAALIDWLASGPPEALTIATLAHRVGWSASHFAHRFREHMGMPPLMWLEARRIEQAKRLLLTTSLAMKAIAVATGFRDSQHLARRFHRLVGCTPGDFRSKQ